MKYHPDKNNESDYFLYIKGAYDFLLSGKKWEPMKKADYKKEKYNTKNSWGYFLWWRDNFFMGEQ